MWPDTSDVCDWCVSHRRQPVCEIFIYCLYFAFGGWSAGVAKGSEVSVFKLPMCKPFGYMVSIKGAFINIISTLF